MRPRLVCRWRLPRVRFGLRRWSRFYLSVELGRQPTFDLHVWRFDVSAWFGHSLGCECDDCLPF